LTKNTFTQIAEEDIIASLLNKQMEKRKKERRIWKSDVKERSFLKYPQKPNVLEVLVEYI
jgi:hypothetical protein